MSKKISSAIASIKSVASGEVSHLRSQNKMIGVLVTAVFPALIATVIGVYGDLTKLGWAFFWIPLGVFVVIHCFLSVFYIKDDKLVHEVYHSAQDIINENAELSNDLSELSAEVVKSYAHMGATLYWIPMTYEYIRLGFNTAEEFREIADELFSVVIEGRFELFGCTEKELWNFSCYIFDEETQLLVPVWRQKSNRLPSSGLGRSWEIGTGHVGKAFADREAKITADATHETVIDHMRAPAPNRRAYDESVYRSFAAIPIQLGNEGGRPIGILVGTSDVAGRFTADNSLILYHAANTLAMLIRMNHTPFREILHNEQEATDAGGEQ